MLALGPLLRCLVLAAAAMPRAVEPAKTEAPALLQLPAASAAAAPAAAAALPEPAPAAAASAVEQARQAAPAPGREPGRLGAEFDRSFVRTIDGEVSFPQVELVRRNHAIGLYEGAPLRLRPWIPASARAVLGVDQRGRLFHVLELGDRTVGYLLSGDKAIRAAFLSERGALVAVDRDGRLHQYSAAQWGKGGLPRLLAASAARFAAGLLALGGLLAGYQWLSLGGPWPVAPEGLAAFGLGAVSLAMLEGFRAGVKYEAQNALTDGLRPLDARVPGYKSFEAEGAQVRLLGEGGERSLEALLDRRSGFKPGETENFDVQEKHARLPRGIDPRAYEPDFR